MRRLHHFHDYGAAYGASQNQQNDVHRSHA
jgi:hypothetical protein